MPAISDIRPLHEQTLMNGYVFANVMRDPKRMKPFLELILGKEIRKIQIVEREEVLKEKYEAKGVRLDPYVEDIDGIIYDVEVQTTDKHNLGKRIRYYQSILDISFFPTGADYQAMRKSYVIFICNYDPYGQEKSIYRFQNRSDEDPELLMGDDTVKIVVNTKGKLKNVSPEFEELITYLDSGKVTGSYSQDLDDAVQELINNEERGQEYMLWMAYGAEREADGKYRTLVEQIRNWDNRKSNQSAETVAELLCITMSQLNAVLDVIRDHPDWDDAQISYEVDWSK